MVVRTACIDDRTQINDLLQKYGFTGFTHEDWAHRWVDNPFSIDAGLDWPIGWVLENSRGQIKGFLGNIPLLYELAGRQIIAAAASSWVVDEDCRGSSLKLVAAYFAQDAQLLINTTANAIAEKIFVAFGSKRPPVPDYNKPLYWICAYRRFGEAVMNHRGKSGWCRAAGSVLAVVLFLWDLRQRYCRRMRGEFPVLLKEFDSRFDIFWEKLRSLNTRKLLCLRRRVDLEWRFGDGLKNGTVWVYVTGTEQIRSYAVFRVIHGGASKLERVRLIDWQTLLEHSRDLKAFVSAACDKARNERILMVEVIGLPRSDRQILYRLKPHCRTLPSWPFLYRIKDEDMRRLLENEEAWHPSPYDGDASL